MRFDQQIILDKADQHIRSGGTVTFYVGNRTVLAESISHEYAETGLIILRERCSVRGVIDESVFYIANITGLCLNGIATPAPDDAHLRTFGIDRGMLLIDRVNQCLMLSGQKPIMKFKGQTGPYSNVGRHVAALETYYGLPEKGQLGDRVRAIEEIIATKGNPR